MRTELGLFVIHVSNVSDIRAVNITAPAVKLVTPHFKLARLPSVCVYLSLFAIMALFSIIVHHAKWRISLANDLINENLSDDCALEKHELHVKTAYQTRTMKGRNPIFFICNCQLVSVSSFQSAVNLQGSVANVWVVTYRLHWERIRKNDQLITDKV